MNEFFQALHDYMELTSWAAYAVFASLILTVILFAVMFHKVSELNSKLEWLVKHPIYAPVFNPPKGSVTDANNRIASNEAAAGLNPDRFGWERSGNG